MLVIISTLGCTFSCVIERCGNVLIAMKISLFSIMGALIIVHE